MVWVISGEWSFAAAEASRSQRTRLSLLTEAAAMTGSRRQSVTEKGLQPYRPSPEMAAATARAVASRACSDVSAV